MNEYSTLAAEFDAARPHLRSVAYRLLGSAAEADDAIQEAWLRLSRSDADAIDNLGGWLTTVVARICLDMLRSRDARQEEPLDELVEPASDHADATVDQDIVLAESLSAALLIVLETLSPAERLAFVLHDLFAVPFEDIAQILGRSSVAARQLASRARRRVQRQTAAAPPHEERVPNRELVEAFLAASRNGDFAALLSLLDPDVVMRVDAAAMKMGAATDVRGAEAVAKVFAGRAQAAEVAIVGDEAGIVWAPGGKPRVAFQMTVRDGRIVTITMIADSHALGIVRSLGGG